MSGLDTEVTGARLDGTGVEVEAAGIEGASELTGQTVVETAVVMVTILIDDTGQSGISEEQA